MRLLVLTHVKHIKEGNKWFAYAPYVREMNIWFKHVEQVEVVAPIGNHTKSDIDLDYRHDDLILNQIPEIDFSNAKKAIVSTFYIPYILRKIFLACYRADHIHLRCPGNIGLLGCFVQMFFPKKIKTAKYAGNWDPSSAQPFSYKIQKWLLSNTFLSKNMQVLVYGNWPNQTKNIKTFFTASYYENEKEELIKKDYSTSLKFAFVGSLVLGKQPLLCLDIIERLIKNDLSVTLDFYGEGALKSELESAIVNKGLETRVIIHGNVDKEKLIEAYKTAHFVILPSKSEGWPKALAEGMFFGAIPIATNVSCVSWMLDEGRRGIIISNDLNEATKKIYDVIENGNLPALSIASQLWSQQYTLDDFESAIVKLLKSQ